MQRQPLERFIAIAQKPEEYNNTVAYLAKHLSRFLRPQERVLLCFSDAGPGSTGALMEQAVKQAGAESVFWGTDQSWQALLRQAFFSRATAIVGLPLVVLGLTKLTKATGTPLRIRNVLLAGAPSEEWMIEGIQKGLDANIWGIYDPIPGLVVGGFSCPKSHGVHIRQDALSVRVDQDRQIHISPLSEPELSYATSQRGRLITESCSCGDPNPRLTEFETIRPADPALDGLQEMLLSWTGILDYRAMRTEMGLELEVVAFPGERLPKLPSCARLHVRPWIPKHDVPFCVR